MPNKQYYWTHKDELAKKKAEYRRTHKPQIKAYYEKNKAHFQAYQREYRQKHKEQCNKNNQKYKRLHKDVIKAENKAYYRLPLGDKCIKCGSTENLVRHHPDYSKPLEIVTLCHTCNVNERVLGES